MSIEREHAFYELMHQLNGMTHEEQVDYLESKSKALVHDIKEFGGSDEDWSRLRFMARTLIEIHEASVAAEKTQA